jgi:hypothetical protein
MTRIADELVRIREQLREVVDVLDTDVDDYALTIDELVELVGAVHVVRAILWPGES